MDKLLIQRLLSQLEEATSTLSKLKENEEHQILNLLLEKYYKIYYSLTH